MNVTLVIGVKGVMQRSLGIFPVMDAAHISVNASLDLCLLCIGSHVMFRLVAFCLAGIDGVRDQRRNYAPARVDIRLVDVPLAAGIGLRKWVDTATAHHSSARHRDAGLRGLGDALRSRRKR